MLWYNSFNFTNYAFNQYRKRVSGEKMTPMKEDYLKIIFELGGGKQQVSNKQISLGLGIAAGSVTEMITKLDDEGFP